MPEGGGTKLHDRTGHGYAIKSGGNKGKRPGSRVIPFNFTVPEVIRAREPTITALPSLFSSAFSNFYAAEKPCVISGQAGPRPADFQGSSKFELERASSSSSSPPLTFKSSGRGGVIWTRGKIGKSCCFSLS